MSKYRKEINIIIKELDLNKNKPMSYEELRSVLFNVKDNIFLTILSDMFIEGLLISNGDKYQLPAIMYAEKIEKANKKRQSIIDANNRLLKIRDKFTEPYYEIEDAKKKYISALNSTNIENFEIDIKTLGYTVSNNYLIFQFTNISEYLTNELLKINVIEINNFIQKYEPLIKHIDLNYLLEKMKQNYQIIEFEKGAYINIKQLNQMGIYMIDIKMYCSAIFDFQKDGTCFSIKSLRKNGFSQKLDDLGMEDIFYENLLKYDNRFLCYKMTNCYVFSTEKKPSVSSIVFDIVKKNKVINIYDLQNILKKEYGIATSIISESGSLINQSLLFDENTTLFYSREFEKIYFNKEDFYKEVEYDE